jgi:predicted deacylase
VNRKVSKQAAVTIGGVTVQPGTRVCVDIPVANLYTHTSLHMPVQVVNGKREGPTLFVSAAIHGDELNGVEIVRRLVAQKVLSRLRGCLIAVPIVNVHGFLDQSRYLPDRRDLNRSFPGSPKGSIAARLAHTFTEEVIRHADYGIDMHTGAIHRSNLPQIRANLSSPRTRELAAIFDVPVLIDAPVRDGSLRGYAAELDIPTLLYEAGEALRFDEVCIRAGLRGVRNVMRHLDMLPRVKNSRNRIEPLVATSTSWIRAVSSGIVRLKAALGQRVEKGQSVATISDPFGESEVTVIAPYSGIVIGRTNLPLAHEGDALMHVARFDSVGLATETVAEFQAELQPPDMS